MRGIFRTIVLCSALALTTGTTSGCKNVQAEKANVSVGFVPQHLQSAATTVTRNTSELQPTLVRMAPSFVQTASGGNEQATRSGLRALLGGQGNYTADLTFFPISLFAYVNRDGVVVAEAKPDADDQLKGQPFGTQYPIVQTALGGTNSQAIIDFRRPQDARPRPYFTTAVPLRNSENAVIGALVAGIPLSRLGRNLTDREKSQNRAAIVWFALQYGGRTLPGEGDLDTEEIFWVRPALTSHIPSDIDARLRSGNQTTWTYVEDGSRGWGAGAINVPGLEGVRVIVFRSENNQSR